MKKQLLGPLCGALMVTGLSACGMGAPPGSEQAPQKELATEVHPHSDRGGIGLEPQERTLSAMVGSIDPRRTLAVTERAILASFPITDTFNQLVQ